MAKERRKAVLLVKSAIDHRLIGSNGGYMRYLITIMKSHLGVSWCEIGLLIEHLLQRDDKSVS